MCRSDNADIGLIATKGYKNTMANGNLPLQLWRNGISEHAVERKRQDDVDKQLSDDLEEISGRNLPSVIVGIHIVPVLELTRLTSCKVIGDAQLEVT